MYVRDAVERDAEALASLVETPSDALRNAIHDRTVRVAMRGDAESDTEEMLGFVSFDVSGDLVHVTQFGGPRDVCERLLEEPIRFAENEGLGVEVVVTANDDAMRTAVETVGFEKKGSGPMFEGVRTVRYRLTP